MATGYDAAGNVVSQRTRAAQTTTIAYDALNRPTSIDAPAGTMDVALTYDNLGRVRTSGGNGQTLTNVWDPLSRLTSETGPLGAMSYQYDAAGAQTRITWPDGFYAQYDRDLYGAATAIRENGAVSGVGVLATYAYNNLGQPTGITRGNGATTSYGYDAAFRMTSLTHNLAGSAQDVTYGYGYNPAGQITSRTVSNAAYVYAPATGSTSYLNNGLNALSWVSGTVVTYDVNGNITGAVGKSFGHDAAGRMISGGGSSFGHDPAGRLYSASSEGVRFQYAGQQLVGEYSTGGAILTRHVPGPGLDQPITTHYGAGLATRLWMAADERQSVISLSDGSGASLGINRYDEYGVASASNRFQYTGQMWLPTAGVYHYRARTYLPQIGRFLQTDPIGYQAGANLYAYVGADPVNWTDPMGLQEATNPGDVIVTGRRFRRVPMSIGTAGSQPNYRERLPEGPVERVERNSPSGPELEAYCEGYSATRVMSDVSDGLAATAGTLNTLIRATPVQYAPQVRGVMLATALIGGGAEIGSLGVSIYMGYRYGDWAATLEGVTQFAVGTGIGSTYDRISRSLGRPGSNIARTILQHVVPQGVDLNNSGPCAAPQR